jgi:hypothetical protein
LYAGCPLPPSKQVELDPSDQQENSTGTPTNKQKNGAGLILWFFFLQNKK